MMRRLLIGKGSPTPIGHSGRPAGAGFWRAMSVSGALSPLRPAGSLRRRTFHGSARTISEGRNCATPTKRRPMSIGQLRMSSQMALVLLACWASRANADTGPYIWHLPFAGLILVVVIVLEALVAHAVIGTSWRASIRVAGAANIASAFVGIGIATLLGMLMVELEHDPALGQSSQSGVASAGLMIMLVCFPFFLSVLVEYLVARAMLRRTAKRLVRNWAWAANLVSYGGLWLILLVRILA